MLAQLTGKPILPISVAASHTWRFRTWDQFELPLPFSRVVIAYGEPVKMPRGIDADSLARWQAEMAERLQQLQQQARAELEADSGQADSGQSEHDRGTRSCRCTSAAASPPIRYPLSAIRFLTSTSRHRLQRREVRDAVRVRGRPRAGAGLDRAAARSQDLLVDPHLARVTHPERRQP